MRIWTSVSYKLPTVNFTLSVMYNPPIIGKCIIEDNEPGVGPGPLKEFFEMCLTLFTTEPIPSSASTTEDQPEDTLTMSPIDLGDLEENMQSESEEVHREMGVEEAKAEETVDEHTSSYLYSSLFPLFQPAGEAYPECIIPRPLQLIGHSQTFLISFIKIIICVLKAEGREVDMVEWRRGPL